MHDLWLTLIDAMSAWHQGKLFVEHAFAIDHDALHVLVGLLAWLAFALVLRRPVTSWLPFLWCLALILWNETVDLWVEQWPEPGMQYGECAKDVILTLLAPALLMMTARLRPDLFRKIARRRRRRG
jgi:hypothetical protein